MSVAHALTIQGWMHPTEVEWLHARAAGLGLVVEFGSWRGRSSVALASAKRLLCVDTWRGSEEGQHKALLAEGLDIWAEWWRNLHDYPHATPCKLDLADPYSVSLLVGIIADEGGADMVFVDAAHDYESVRRDIQTAMRLLKPGGLLCGHDHSHSWPDVKRAVDELVPQRQIHHTIWWENHGQ